MSAFTTREESGSLVVAITDPTSLNEFRNTPFHEALFSLIQSLEKPRLAIDMRQVDYLSSSGVAILVGLKRRLDARDGRAVLFRIQPAVLDLLRIMKLDRYLSIVEDEDQALASLRSAPSV